MSTTTTDRIEKQVRLRHPRSRVWRALTDSREFGQWFGAIFTDRFEAGARVRGGITHKGYEHMTMDITIERMEPERLFSWRWHPGGAEPGESFEHEPMTLVVFELEDVPGGTLLRVVETGFDQIPLARRAKAFKDNEGGWTGQMKAIEDHLDRSS
jgi:uncharacterized protein YndB with AHSA1/START domain